MKNKTFIVGLLIVSLGLLLFIYHDDFLYKTPILRITKVETKKEDISINSLGLKEKYYQQEITGIYTNSNKKGLTKTILYEEAYSSVVTDKYKVGDKVLVKDNTIIGLKRDFYISIMIFIFILSILIVGEWKGALSVLSVMINTIIFYIGLILYFKGINLLFLTIIESFLFSILSLMIANGRNKKTKSAILSTITTFMILLSLILVLGKITNYSGINYNELSFLTVPIDHILLPELMIGILGVSMDVAITISSSIEELITKNPKIDTLSLKKSAKEIGKDIMTTMSNVLFFTYICAGLPLFVLALRNGFSFTNYISTNFSLEITRFLVGSIAIILTIPVSSLISIKIMRGGVSNE